MYNKIAQIVFGISSFVIGGLLGAIIQNQIDAGINPLYLIVFVLAISIFAIIFLVFSFLSDEIRRDERLVDSITLLQEQIGLKVYYQELHEVHRKGANQEDILARIMKEAENEVLELGHSEVHDRPVNPDLAPSAVRQIYYDSILQRVEKQSDKGVPFVYKRIIQFPEENSSIVSLAHISHFTN